MAARKQFSRGGARVATTPRRRLTELSALDAVWWASFAHRTPDELVREGQGLVERIAVETDLEPSTVVECLVALLRYGTVAEPARSKLIGVLWRDNLNRLST